MQYITDARQAELNAAERMREMGFKDAKATAVGADAGIDVQASAAIGQVKWQGGQVGRPDIQRLYGARGHRHHLQLFFFSASGYSKGAIQYADESDVKLFTYAPTGVVTPANRVAKSFIEQRQQAVQQQERDRRAREQAEEARRREEERANRERYEAERAKQAAKERADDLERKRAVIEAELVAQENRDRKRRQDEQAARARHMRDYADRLARENADPIKEQKRADIEADEKVPSTVGAIAALIVLLIAELLLSVMSISGLAAGLVNVKGAPAGERVSGLIAMAVILVLSILALRSTGRALSRREAIR
ncbi:MAG: hypothetical protein EOP32_08975 [Rhodococcus sp. (in: high G+C Gram-positive bacteria)]|nr:MAG: hypothetical protein EOP32_08975 [Rhodococcus sp. (in: high G+C Gram-positive bacteria)]